MPKKAKQSLALKSRVAGRRAAGLDPGNGGGPREIGLRPGCGSVKAPPPQGAARLLSLKLPVPWVPPGRTALGSLLSSHPFCHLGDSTPFRKAGQACGSADWSPGLMQSAFAVLLISRDEGKCGLKAEELI